jgi:hypothetical protein
VHLVLSVIVHNLVLHMINVFDCGRIAVVIPYIVENCGRNAVAQT